MEIDTVHDGFSVVVFMNVHEIVHDPFLASVKGIIPVITLVCGIVEFWVSGIFVNTYKQSFNALFLPPINGHSNELIVHVCRISKS